MIAQIKLLYQKQEEIKQEIIELAPQLFDYFEVIFKDRFKGWKLKFNPSAEKIKLLPNGVSYEYEYNDACNCHPEYSTYEFILTFEDLSLTPHDLEAKIEEQYKKREAELKKQKEEGERAQKILFEDGERKLYEELKKKFEEQK